MKEKINRTYFAQWDGSFPETYLSLGTEETNSDTRSLLAKLNLSPYSSDVKGSPSTVMDTGYRLDDSSVDFRFLYTGREFNIETGSYYYRARIMDSSIGRFTSKDHYPTLNKYFYADDDPINYIDPMGLWVFKVGIFGSAGAVGGGRTGIGIAIGHSKECGWTIGTYSEAGGGSHIGASASVGFEFGFGTQKSVQELNGQSVTTGVSGRLPIGVGFGGDLEVSGSGAMVSVAFSAGVGTPAEGHSQVVDTTVNVKKKGKCK